MDFSSKLLENAVNEMSQFPGIGKRTALRLVLHLLKQPQSQTLQLTQSLQQMREEIIFCKKYSFYYIQRIHTISSSKFKLLYSYKFF